MSGSLRIFALLSTAASVLPSSVAAQAKGTAHQRFRIQAYALGSYVRPDFGGANKNVGATVGGTLNAYSFHQFEIGLDARAVGSGGRVSKQFFYGGGPRLQYDWNRFEPFVAYHLGYGKLDFQQVTVPNYTYDNSLVTALNGGVDFRLSRTWAVRGEVERQSWQFNKSSPAFHPLAVSVGLRYQFHFRNPYGPE